MASLFWLMLLAFSSVVRTQNVPGNNASQRKSIFILAGQSNMAGRGGLIFGKWDGKVPPESAPNPQILRLSAGLKWEEAHEPIHTDIDNQKPCGLGPAMPFANSVLQRDKDIGVIGLVPCAVGGTNISQWSQGSELYNQILMRVRAALQGGGGQLKAMLWYQGEADTATPEDATAYKQKLVKFFNDIRSDLQSPRLPIIQVELASGVDPKSTEIVRKAQREINLPNVITINALGLPLQTDNLHLNSEGALRLGGMLADAYIKDLSSTPVRRMLASSTVRRMLAYAYTHH